MTELAPLPIQPVAEPILCSPYEEPDRHWQYDRDSHHHVEVSGRRTSRYWHQGSLTGSKQRSLFMEEDEDDLPLVNLLRANVRDWRAEGYPHVTAVTRQLLLHWGREDRARRLFFCQLEAVETIIYLTEVLEQNQRVRHPQDAQGRPIKGEWLRPEDFQALLRGEAPRFTEGLTVPPALLDFPSEAGLQALRRYGCKMATGSGKTVVMAMLIAWTLCNRARMPNSERFPGAVFVACPNLTIKERLQVLRPDYAKNYYQAFDLVPAALLPDLRKGRVKVDNWHQMGLESPHAEAGATFRVVDKGEEDPDTFARRFLGELYGRGPILVMNDEAHHAYRPAPVAEGEHLSAEEKADLEEATLWVQGLDRLNRSVGVRFCVDLSATPFYLKGSGHPEGSPFPWLISDFGLVDAIESGITKIPRLPVADTTGRPDPKYFRLWREIMENLRAGDKLSGGKPKPEVVWREAEGALRTLADQWLERFQQMEAAAPGQECVPPVLIVVCDNTDIARLFFERISGETVLKEVEVEDDDDEAPKRGKKKRTVAYGPSALNEAFANTEQRRATLRIDSKLLAEAESATGSRKDAAEELRKIVSTVGVKGEPGEQVRCVVSVQMLSEGWDANSVTHILGLRAFGSQLLCEQVVGRGLRRLDYTPYRDAQGRWKLHEEYVDVYGVPFSVIPFKGRPVNKPAPEDKPKNHVKALPERQAFEIEFPNVEGYAFELKRNVIKAEVAAMESLALEPLQEPTAVFVAPQVGYAEGNPSGLGQFPAQEQNREQYYGSTHLQTLEFELARRIVSGLLEGKGDRRLSARTQGRQQLFPQVLWMVKAYTVTKVQWNGCHPAELGLERYMERLTSRFLTAIEPDEAQGEQALVPILNRYQPKGSTARVDFKTTKPCKPTVASHINQAAMDTIQWEQSAAFALEQAAGQGLIRCYARNERLEFNIPYEYDGLGHSYQPDFLVQIAPGRILILEIKGEEDDVDRAKHEAARRWVRAVTRWGDMGRWDFLVCRDVQTLLRDLHGAISTI
ncbi:MAG: DEAD/DEAH box helicase family protein [Geothrix sp.]|nr:DEAD/DEAH box helicase family protein [Geothrix sp.]